VAIVGDAYVVIRAVTEQLRGDIEKGLRDAARNARRAGEEAGEEYSAGFGGRVQSVIGPSLNDAIDSIAPEDIGAGHGSRYSSSFADGVGGVRDDIQNSLAPVQDVAAQAGETAGAQLSQGMGRGIAADTSIEDAIGNKASLSEAIFNERGGKFKLPSIPSSLFRIGALIPIIGVLVSGLSALAAGLFSVAAAAAPAVGALAGMPGVIAAVLQGVGALALAFGGIGAAYKALGVASKAAGGNARVAGVNQRAAAEAVRNAQRGVRDAKIAVADAAEEGADRIRNANRNLVETEEQVAEANEAAARRVIFAQRALADAQDSARDAQEQLNDAREAARERLEDLALSLSRASLSEERASLTLEKAAIRLKDAQTRYFPDDLERREAQLAYDEAKQSLVEVLERNQDLRTEAEDAQKQQVAGADAVVRAQERIIDTNTRIADATYNLRKAQEEQRDTARDTALRLSDAQEAVADAQEAAARRNAEAVDRLAEAQRRLGQAMERSAGGTAAGTRAFSAAQQALDALSPQARSFVLYLFSIRGEFKKLRAEAGAELFPQLETALRSIVSSGLFDQLAGILRVTGRELGGVARYGADLVTSPAFRSDLATIGATNATIIGNFGRSAVNLGSALASLTATAAPLLRRFGAYVETMTAGVAATTEAGQQSGRLGAFLDRAGDSVAQFGRIIGNIIGGLLNLGKIAAPAGQSLLDSFEKATEKFQELTGSDANRERFAQYFEDVATNVRAIGRLFNTLVIEVAKLGDDPALAEIADGLTELMPVLGEAVSNLTASLGPSIVELAGSFLELFKTVSESGALENFISVLTLFADVLNGLLQSPIGSLLLPLIGIVGAVKALSLVGKFTGLSQLGKILGSGGIGSVLFGGKDATRNSGAVTKFIAGFKDTNVVGPAGLLGRRFGAKVGIEAGRTATSRLTDAFGRYK